MNVLVLGGYGLIGEAIVDRLVETGHSVTGLGRDVRSASRRKPAVRWIADDIATLLAADAWQPHLAGIDAVVNAAGALQDGARDRLEAVHRAAIEALVDACERTGVRRFIQISAVGADAEAPTDFMRTKAQGDAVLRQSALDWTIFRPGLVIAPQAYGGTALLRALAALPSIIPVVYPQSRIRTVSVFDVSEAVGLALLESKTVRGTFDLVEQHSHSLVEIITALRNWLGLGRARVVRLPAFAASASGAVADLLGWLGWRSPLRSNAMRVLRDGVEGNSAPWLEATGHALGSLSETLSRMPATAQERWFARIWILKPTIVFCLAAFWLVSGVIGLAQRDAAMAILTSRGFDVSNAAFAVIVGSIADLAVGAAILVRRSARAALLGMIAITLGYLAAATLFTPDLWLDPLGPLVKSVPALLLCLVALAILEER